MRLPASTYSADGRRHVHVAHLITGLRTGGAEMMLLKLISASDPHAFRHSVISMTDGGDLKTEFHWIGVRLDTLGMSPGLPDIRGLVRARQLLMDFRPDVLQTWMYHADLLGTIAAIGTGIPVVWGIHHSVLDPEHTKPVTRFTQRAGAWLSRVAPRQIVCCSRSAREVHEQIGYAPDRMRVIPNGFDAVKFRHRASDRVEMRRELGIEPERPLVGTVARYDPNKDFANFAATAARVRAALPETRFVLVGNGCSKDNRELHRLLSDAGVLAYCHLLGKRTDVARILSALDVLCSSSSSEGFPNVLGEAMCCEVPCAVTSCGDSADIVGDTGRVAPVRDAEALAAAVLSILRLGVEERAMLGKRARERVIERFGLEAVAREYESIYREVVNGRPQ